MKKMAPLLKFFAAGILLLMLFFGYWISAKYYASFISRSIDMTASRSEIESKIGWLSSRQISVNEIAPIYVETLEPESFTLVEYSIPFAYFVVVYDLAGYPIYKIGLGI